MGDRKFSDNDDTFMERQKEERKLKRIFSSVARTLPKQNDDSLLQVSEFARTCGKKRRQPEKQQNTHRERGGLKVSKLCFLELTHRGNASGIESVNAHQERRQSSSC